MFVEQVPLCSEALPLILHATTNPLLPPPPGEFGGRVLRHVQVDVEKSEIVHHVQGDLLPNRAGTSVARSFRIEDGELILEWIGQNGGRNYRGLPRLEAF